MKYEIKPLDDTVEITITDEGVSEKLTMLEAPYEESVLVQKSRKDILGEIDLEKMLANLEDCVDLLQITFNAVDGFEVQSMVQDLSTKFSNAMIESNAAALDFKLATERVADAYIDAYGCLFYGDIEVALSILTSIKPIADKMVLRSKKLISTYDELTNNTNVILKAVMDERASDEKKRKETEALVIELTASVKAMNELKENLANDIKQFEDEYKKLEDLEIKQEKRAYGLQLAATIIGGIGSLFGKSYDASSKKEDRDESVNAVEGNNGKTSTETKAENDYYDNIRQQEEMKSRIRKIEERISKIDSVLDGKLYKDGEKNSEADVNDPDTQKTGDELREEKRSLSAEKADCDDKLKELEGKEKTLTDTLSKFGVAIDEISKTVRSTAQEMQKRADSLLERMDVIRKRRDELKDMERENISNLAEYTAKLQNAVIDKNSLESAIQSLVIAIGCLRRVLAYLQEIKLFWENVRTFCDALASDQKITILVDAQGNKDPEDRAAYFKTIMFVRGYLTTLLKWKALNVVFTEYLEALSKVAKKLNASFEQKLSADRTVQWQLASKLAGELKVKLKSEAAEMV